MTERNPLTECDCGGMLTIHDESAISQKDDKTMIFAVCVKCGNEYSFTREKVQ